MIKQSEDELAKWLGAILSLVTNFNVAWVNVSYCTLPLPAFPLSTLSSSLLHSPSLTSTHLRFDNKRINVSYFKSGSSLPFLFRCICMYTFLRLPLSLLYWQKFIASSNTASAPILEGGGRHAQFSMVPLLANKGMIIMNDNLSTTTMYTITLNTTTLCAFLFWKKRAANCMYSSVCR